MKRLWIGVFFLLFLLAAGVGMLLATGRFHEGFSQTMEAAAEAAMAGRWEEAEKAAHRGRAQWDACREFLAAFTDHEPVEEAVSLFSQLEMYQSKRYDVDFAAICLELSHLSEAICESHGLHWWSIL